MWLGPAPYKPTIRSAFPRNFTRLLGLRRGGPRRHGPALPRSRSVPLGKDNTSPIRVDVDAPQQHYDAVGSWRRIEYTYADGCKIILGRARTRTPRPPTSRARTAKISGASVRTCQTCRDLIATLPDPEPQIGTFLRLGALAPEVRAERDECAPLGHDREPWRDRTAARPDASLRPGDAAHQQ